MTPCSHCGCPMPVVPPERVVAYLEGRRWIRDRTTWAPADGLLRGAPIWATWRLYDNGMRYDIEVPMCADFRDYPRRYLELLADLRRIEGRSMAEIAEEMGR